MTWDDIEMGQGQYCTANAWYTSIRRTQITASRWPMLHDQLCAIVTRGFNVEGPSAWIACNTRMWMWSGNWVYRVCVKCQSAGSDTCKMLETVRVISGILHMVNGDMLQVKS